MKKNFKLIPFAVLTIAALASCSEINPETQAKDYFYNDDPAAMTLSASTQATVPETKTAFAPGDTKAAVNWVKGDAITVFDAENKNVEFTTEANGVTSGTFAETVTGSFTKSSDIDAVFYSVYPYSEENSIAVNEGNTELTVVVPDNQIVSHSTFAPKANVAVAKSDADGNLAFQNLCGYLRFVITKGDRIKSVTISGTNNEVIAGKVKVQWKDGEPKVTEIVDGKTSITFSLEDGSTFPSGNTYFVTLLPQTLSGIRIEMTTVEDVVTVTGITTDGTELPRTMNPVKTASSPIKIERNKVLRLPYWDRLEWRSAMLLDVQASCFPLDGNLNSSEINSSNGKPYAKVTDIYSYCSSEYALYKVVENPCSTSVINPSSKVLKVDASGKSYTNNGNARLSVYSRSPFYSGDTPPIRKFNAVRIKVYYGDNGEETNKKYFPRVQMGPNDWKDANSNVQARPIFTPTYVNGVKMSDVYIMSTGSNTTESLSNYIGTYNNIPKSWVDQYHSAIRFDDWNDLVYVIGDEGSSKTLINGTNYLRIHPFFPAVPGNSTAYHPETFGVMYIDDIELIDF